MIHSRGAEGQVERRHQHDAPAHAEQPRDQPARGAGSDERCDHRQPGCVRFHRARFIVENHSDSRDCGRAALRLKQGAV